MKPMTKKVEKIANVELNAEYMISFDMYFVTNPMKNPSIMLNNMNKKKRV